MDDVRNFSARQLVDAFEKAFDDYHAADDEHDEAIAFIMQGDCRAELLRRLDAPAGRPGIDAVAQRFCDSLFDEPLQGAMWADLSEEERDSFRKTVNGVLAALASPRTASPPTKENK